MSPGREKKRPGRLRRLLVWSVVLLVVLIVVHGVADAFLGAKWKEVSDAARAEGVLASREADTLAPLDNAMTDYLEAAQPLLERYDENPKADPAGILYGHTPNIWADSEFALSEDEDQALSYGVATMSTPLRAFRAVAADKAFQLRLALDAERGDASDRAGAELRSIGLLGRYAAVRGWWEATRGNLDGACGWLEASFLLAERLRDQPLLVTGVTRLRMGLDALTALKATMLDHEIPETWRARLDAAMAPMEDREVFARALATETGYTLDMLAQRLEEDDSFGGYLVRPAARWQLLKLLRSFTAGVRTVRETDAGTRLAAYTALMEDQKSMAVFPASYPTVLAALRQFEDGAARCAMLRLSMELRAYRAENGTYPEDLDTLPAGAGTTDGYTGQAFEYRREETGFELRSPGAAWAAAGGEQTDTTLVCRFED